MDLRNCKGCGKMFQVAGYGVFYCQRCIKENEEKFKVVKEFIKTNPRSTIDEVSDGCDVTIPQINQWIREERLTFSDDSPIGLDCESCGKMIRTGRYCPECKNKMINSLGGGPKKATAPARQPATNTKAKMRFLDH